MDAEIGLIEKNGIPGPGIIRSKTLPPCSSKTPPSDVSLRRVIPFGQHVAAKGLETDRSDKDKKCVFLYTCEFIVSRCPFWVDDNGGHLYVAPWEKFLRSEEHTSELQS